MSNENIIGPTVKNLHHEYLYLHAGVEVAAWRVTSSDVGNSFFFRKKKDLLRIIFGECVLYRIYIIYEYNYVTRLSVDFFS